MGARPKTLVVYYSRSGATAKLGDAIATVLGADVERLEDTVDRRGFFGLLTLVLDQLSRRRSTLKPLKLDPSRYDVVVIGTPDWGRAVSGPVRAFLETWRGFLPRVAFFLTDGEGDHRAVFRELERLTGVEPIAELGVPHRRAISGQFGAGFVPFVEALALQPLPRRAAPMPLQA